MQAVKSRAWDLNPALSDSKAGTFPLKRSALKWQEVVVAVECALKLGKRQQKATDWSRQPFPRVILPESQLTGESLCLS